MDSLPVEMIGHTLTFLDAKSLSTVSYLSHFFHTVATEQLQWIKLCCTEALCQPLLRAAMLEEELLNREIDAKSLYTSIQEGDIGQIKDLLFSKEQVREFALYAPFYERAIPQFFPRAVHPARKLYLTEDSAKKDTPNAVKVKHWLRVKVSVDRNSFDELYYSQQLQSAESIKSMPIIVQRELKCSLSAGEESRFAVNLQAIS
ncbi:MAG: F-box protein [Legionella sp.]|uniref:F-box protein n=1 Tax=Legionella sp. TaxID=459 RepID=UPI00284B8F08|nr:F-box protein [Legionella sp.]